MAKRQRSRPARPRKIEDLKPCPRNPRRIAKGALLGLQASVVTFGDIAGITWNRRTGTLVTGHQRLEPRYCDVAVQRWEQFTGRKAKRMRRSK